MYRYKILFKKSGKIINYTTNGYLNDTFHFYLVERGQHELMLVNLVDMHHWIKA